MNKLELDQLEIINQIEYMNNKIKLDTISNVCKSIGIGRTTVSDRFKKVGYIYNKELGQYAKDNTIAIQLHLNDKRKPQTSKIKTIEPVQESITKELQKYRDDLMELVNYKDSILEMLKYHQNNVNVIDVQQLDINALPEELQKDIVNKSIKIYSPVYEKFNSVCGQYNSHKKQDLISLALYEFCTKYEK